MPELRAFIKSIPTLPRGGGELAVFTFDGCRYSCPNTDSAVRAFSKRALRRAGSKRGSSPLKSEAQSKKRTFYDFIRAGEIDNAIAWVELTSIDVVFYGHGVEKTPHVLLDVAKLSCDLVLGSIGDLWSITHVPSGLRLGNFFKSKYLAKKWYKEMKDAPSIKEALDTAPTGFQEVAQRAPAASTYNIPIHHA